MCSLCEGGLNAKVLRNADANVRRSIRMLGYWRGIGEVCQTDNTEHNPAPDGSILRLRLFLQLPIEML